MEMQRSTLAAFLVAWLVVVVSSSQGALSLRSDSLGGILPREAKLQALCELCKTVTAPHSDLNPYTCYEQTWEISFFRVCSRMASDIAKLIKPLVTEATFDELNSLRAILDENHDVKDGYVYMKRTGIDPLYGVVVG